MTKRTENAILAAHENMSTGDFNQWLLEQLAVDINNEGLDNKRLEIIRFVAAEGLLYG